MQRRQRQEAVVQLLAAHGYLSIKELADRLGVSDMTIRRDMRALEERRMVEVVHGGGQIRSAGQELAFSAKRLLHQSEKAAIAKVAWSLVEPGMVVGFSAGTTTWMLARECPVIQGMTFVTNSTNVALVLSQQGASDILLSGGNFRTPSDALVGPLAEQAIRQLKMDILFLGVHGIVGDAGISTPNLLEASIDRVLMERADRVVCVFDHSKWGIEALARIATVDELNLLITDDGDSLQEIQRLQETGAEVLVAHTDVTASVPTREGE